MGDSKSPMYFIAVACVANIALDYLFIGGLGLGSAGAALGTTLSQTISVLVSLAVILKRKMITLTANDFKPDCRTMTSLLKIGVPIALQDGFIQIAFIIITVFANKRGLNDAAAVGIVEKIIAILFLVPSSMLQTVSALSAQNIGAGKHDRARLTLRYACIMAVMWGVGVCILMQLDAEPFIGMFAKDSAEVVRLGSQYMRGYVWDAILAGVHFSFSGYFCAYGLSGISLLHNSLSIICVRIPLSYFASKHFTDTLFPMGLASPAGSALSVVVCVCVFLWLDKRQKAIKKKQE